MAQLGFGPPSLPVGTEVSAKYRGAFCEAKVKTVIRIVKCKVMMKDCQTSIFVTDDEIKGLVKLGSVVEVKHPDTGQPVEATVNKLIDQSTYTVVFDDGDERTLRRTQLCLKGDKHFIESETLDNLPLSHPEHFGTPVLQNKKSKRKPEDDSEEEEEDLSEEESPRRAMYRGRHQELVGKLMVVDYAFRKGSVIPALVVLPDANSISEVKNRDQILVRSFKDSKFLVVTRKDLKEFSRSLAIKNDDKTMRTAFEKALLYHDTKELPVGWDKEEMLGSDIEDEEDECPDDEYASEDEPFEEKDRFVAQLYKFMDDRGTPINKGPSIGNKDLNLYKLFKIVQNLGGYNKVTKEMKWPVVYSKMGLPSIHPNPAHQIKSAYKKYLDAYETFYRKLGSTMGTLSRPGRARQNSGRSILNFRGRDKSPRSPKPPEKVKGEAASPKPKVETATEKLDDSQEANIVTMTEESDVSGRRLTPRRDSRASTIKEELKEKKDEGTSKMKKDESPKVRKEEPTKSKKEEAPKIKKEEKKDDTPKLKKEDTPKTSKKEETSSSTSTSRLKKDPSPSPKTKKEEQSKVKKEEEIIKKEERKSARKAQKEEEKEADQDKDDKKPVRSGRKEKEEEKKEKEEEEKKMKEEEKKEESKSSPLPVVEETPKKRTTRRKLGQLDQRLEQPEVKEEVNDQKEIDEKKDPAKKVVTREKPVEKKERDIPRTLERRDSRNLEKKELKELPKIVEKKEAKSVEKKIKVEDKKLVKKEKKGKDVEMEDEEVEKSDDEEDQVKEAVSKRDFPIGCKLRVKYGRGKTQKIYLAKVIDHGRDGTHKTFLVHYAGWNNRYDEWIRADRVVSVIDKPDIAKVKPTIPVKALSTISSVLKKMKPTKTSPVIKKPGSIFRTPKLVTSKTRSTRSTSSDTAVSNKKPGKPLTRRRSALTDSDSKSSESRASSDAEEMTESEHAEEDSNTKEDEEEYQESEGTWEVEVDVEADTPKDDSSGTSLVDDNEKNEECSLSVCDSVTEMAEEDSVDFEKPLDTPEDLPLPSAETDQERVSLESEKEAESTDTPTEVKGIISEVVKSGKRSVCVALIRQAENEILLKDVELADISEDDIKNEPQDEALSDSSPLEDGQSPELEIIEDVEVQKDALSDNVSDNDESPEKTLDEGPSSPPPIDQGIPQLKKIDLELEKKEKDNECVRLCKGRKSRLNKDAKKSAQSSEMTTSVANEIPTLEPIVAPSASPKIEPSPYDFDAEIDAPWQPEITKKWEPSQKSPIICKDPGSMSEDGLEKEKKKVKKKTKKKPISPEFVVETKVEEKTSSLDETVPSSSPSTQQESRTSLPVAEETSIEKPPVRKKGRKKKELLVETKKEMIDEYENTVNSVVEAVKHSLQESEVSDSDKRPIQKKRRLKRVSESDKKDVSRTPKLNRKFSSKDTSDISETVGRFDDPKFKEDKSIEDPASSVPLLSDIDPAECASSQLGGAETSQSVSRRDRNDPSLSDSIGFEPKLGDNQDTPFDNTPPTTPEHDESEGCGSAAMHDQDSYGASHLICKSETSKPLCPSVTSSSSSLSFPASSSNIAQSKSASESPSDNDVISTGSTDNFENAMTTQHSESSGTEQEVSASRKRKRPDDENSNGLPASKKKKRIHGTRSRTAKKSPKYIGHESSAYKNSDSQGSSSTTPNHCPDSPPTKFSDLAKSPRPVKFNFNADLGEYLEGEARCNFLITKMKEIKTIYMSLKSEVASIDRRRKRIRRKERDSSQPSIPDREVST